MQTQCPHCETKFRVTETQVHAADGFVRCGVCSEVFNAIDVASQHEYPSSLPDISPPDDHEDDRDSDIIVEVAPDEVITDKQESETDTFDFFDEEDDESLQHIVPDEYRDTYSPTPHSILSTVLWSIGILILTLTLALEYIWFNRDQFRSVSELQPTFEKLCQHIECSRFSIREPEKIELVARNVYSHPDEKGALMVNVTMKNNASFTQPYPVMQIDFSDIRGSTVVARRFLPEEYLTPEDQHTLFAAGSDKNITLEILDPGKQAMTYEFNFL